MSLLLRITNNWDKWRKTDLDWLSQGDIPADPLTDLRTINNSLSVWVIDVNNPLLSRKRIAVAFAATRHRLDKLDYLVFNSELVDSLGIQILREKGKSADIELNKKYHCNLLKISARTLFELAKNFLAQDPQHLIKTKMIGRFDRKDIAIEMVAGIVDGRLENIPRKLLEELADFIFRNWNERKIDRNTIESDSMENFAAYILERVDMGDFNIKDIKSELIKKAQEVLENLA